MILTYWKNTPEWHIKELQYYLPNNVTSTNVIFKKLKQIPLNWESYELALNDTKKITAHFARYDDIMIIQENVQIASSNMIT